MSGRLWGCWSGDDITHPNCDLLAVDVEDDGKGKSIYKHDRIFDAFEKTDMDTNNHGSGLALVRKLANLMDGDVTLVSSTPSAGSRLRATFENPICASLLLRPL